MVIKKRIVIIFLIISFICISGAAASDVNDTVIAIDDNNVDGDLIQSVNDTTKSFKDLNTAINSNSSQEIHLDSNYVYNGGGDSSFKNGIKINRTVTIYGNDFTIDGKNVATIFTVTGTNVVFKNINFINCKATNGGAINGACTVINCNFTNTSATQNGGAINGACNLTNCNFINVSSKFDGGAVNGICIAKYCNFINVSSSYNGGALYNSTAINCTFKKNTVSRQGGAMYGGKAINCTFEECKAQSGGAISGNAYTENCTFINNRAVSTYGGAMLDSVAINGIFIGNAAYNGGALYNSSAVNSLFKENVAKYVEGSYRHGYGGAIYAGNAVNCTFIANRGKYSAALYGNCNATNCIFQNNTGDYDGGAMNGGSAINCNFTGNSVRTNGGATYNVNATNCIFKSNYAGQSGAAVYGGTTTYSIFMNNVAKSSGGAIMASTAINCTFINNTALVSGAGSGTAINCTFINNTASKNEGAFSGHATNSTFINNTAKSAGAMSGTAVNCTFINNTASNIAGALSGSAIDSTFINNTAINGGAVYGRTEFGEMVDYVKNCEFINCYASETGGALKKVHAENCTFINNTAVEYGGAIYGGTDSGSIFKNNSAKSGGALYESDAYNSTFENNRALNDGGAMYKGKAISCTFDYNKADGQGGAIYGGEVSIDSIFNGNVANEGNDAYNSKSFVPKKTFADLNRLINGNENDEVYLQDDYFFTESADYAFVNGINITRAVTIHGNGFTVNASDSARIFNVLNNDAVFKDLILVNAHSKEGAAIYGKSLSINCTFKENRADNGGAIFGGNATNCTFIQNRGTYGGAIRFGYVINCTFMQNHANDDGGALCNSTAVNSKFIKNDASYGGGAISWSNATNCTFNSNRASNGGAIWGANCHIINSTFTSNGASNGGAIYGPSFTVINCTFNNNTAKYNGGAIKKDYLELAYPLITDRKFIGTEFDCIVKNCTFTFNKANSAGAVSGQGFIIFDSTFIGNNATLNAGAVSGGIVVNSIFKNNQAVENGGAAYQASLVNSKFESNRAAKGGAISDSIADNCTFDNNVATENGNDCYLSKVSTSSQVDEKNTCDTTFFNNDNVKSFTELKKLIESGEDEINLDCNYTFNPLVDYDLLEGIGISNPITINGGGFTLNGLYGSRMFKILSPNVIIRDMNLIYGKVIRDGGAILGSATAINCTFMENRATMTGGAGRYLIAKNCTFIKNYALRAGAINQGNCDYCIFIGNWAKESVGASSNGPATNCEFISNHALSGGAFSGGNVINSTFLNNSATEGSGGAISNGNANNCTFIKNSATEKGGAITGSKNNNVYDCVFVDNSAKIGGATYGVNVINSTFIENKATESDDSIASGTQENCTFKNKDRISSSNFTANFNDNASLRIALISSNGTLIDSNITIRVYRDDELIGTYHCLSGDEWIVQLDAGEYKAVLSDDNREYFVDPLDIKLTINKVITNVNLDVDVGEVIYGENITVNVTSDADGIATFTIGDTFLKSVNLTANISSKVIFSDIWAGIHNMTVTLKPNDGNYNESSSSTEVSVAKKQTTIELNVEDSVYGKDVIVNVTASEDGNVTVTIGNNTKVVKVSANTPTSINFAALAAESYVVHANFDAGDNYQTSSDEENIIVSPAEANITEIQIEDVYVYGDVTIKVLTNVSGNLTVQTSNGKKTIVVIAGELTSVDLGFLDVGSNNINLTLDAGNNYTKPTRSAVVTVNPKSTTTSVNVADSVYAENVIVKVNASENGRVTVQLGDKIEYVDVQAGITADVDMGVFDVGSYKVNTTFDGGNNYIKSENKTFFKISPKQTTISLSVTEYVSDNPVIVNVTSNVGGNVTIKCGSKVINKTIDANVSAAIDLGMFDFGSYVLFANFTAGNNYINSTDSKNFTVFSKIDENDISIPELSNSVGKSITVKLPSDATGKITLSINGKDYEFDVVDGVANVNVPELADGGYSYSITYSGDAKYSSFTKTGNLNVINPKIVAKDASVQYSAKGKYSVTVYGTGGKVASGTYVIFKIAGKQVAKVKTNSKGVASYVVTKTPGKYVISATALGKTVTKKLTVKHVVTLKTVKVKKSAKKLVLKATVKIGKKPLAKKKVTFKFKGKKYTSKTNKKGIAKVTIKKSVLKKLKVGKKVKYQATYLKDTVKKTVKVKK